MSVEAVYSSPANSTAIVLGYVHDDGTAMILVSPVPANAGTNLTLNIHWTPAEARQVAAMLVAAADATDAAEGLAAMERAK